jgi:hypothetical protein
VGQNYYSGVRRYPYSTDVARNPLTFRAIDPFQSGSDSGEVHNQGEVWCSALWEVRANLIGRYGWRTGNELALLLATDGMRLSPVNPDFLQARDALLLSDMIESGGRNQREIWAGFAKRGMGINAIASPSWTTVGVVESYEGDGLQVYPVADIQPTGSQGGPFLPASQIYTLTCISTGQVDWSVIAAEPWLDLSLSGGRLAPGETVELLAGLNANVLSFIPGTYSNLVVISNHTSGATTIRRVTLKVNPTLGEALNAPELTWSTGGNAPWAGELEISHDGFAAAASGGILNNESSWIETTVTGPATLSFWWQVSSESNFDFLSFYINDVAQPSPISGDVGWQERSYRLPPGTRTLRWLYSKDSSVAVGFDRGWVDEVRITPPPPNTAPRFGDPVTTIVVTNPNSFQVSYGAVDDDTPANTLTFALVSGPDWLTFSQTSAGSAVLTGLPPDVETSAVYTAVLGVTDDGWPPMAAQVSVDIHVVPRPSPGTLQFAQATYVVGESIGPVTLSVTREKGYTGAVSVRYSTLARSAKLGIDYSPTSGTLAWADGDSAPRSITVTVFDDILVETNKFFEVRLSSPRGGARLGTTATASVVIVDNDTPTCPATRQLPLGYLPGVPLTAAIVTKPPPGTSAYSIEELPPSGWSIDSVGGGGVFDSVSGKVKWGPYLDGRSRRLTYRATPPASSTRVKGFAGIVSVNGVTVPICGPTELARLLTHPADLAPADYALRIDEVTSYAAAWRNGATWPTPPVPIEIAFVTRAGFLWRKGEHYLVDSRRLPPLNWIPAQPSSVAASSVAGDAAAKVPTCLRQLPARVESNTVVTVVISVAPLPATTTCAVEEVIPAGWSVGAVSDGGVFDSGARRIKWGPFFDSSPRTLTYRITPRNGNARFSGLGSFDGYNRVTIGPATTVVTGPPARALDSRKR